MISLVLDWLIIATLCWITTSTFVVRKWMRLAFLFFSTLLLLACYYIRLGAPWVGLTHLVIYVGGVLILQLFGMMITQRFMGMQRVSLSKPWVALLASGFLIHLGWLSLSRTNLLKENLFMVQSIDMFVLGRLILGPWLIVFELLSVFLLLSLVGAAFVVRKIIT